MHAKLPFSCIFLVIETSFALLLLSWLRRLSTGGFPPHDTHEGGGLSQSCKENTSLSFWVSDVM